eukprot:jgi/Mesvir1/28767/Mv25849-RA.1
MTPEASKVSAVLEWPVLKSAHDVKSFLGLVGWYRRFIPDMAAISGPLLALLKKDVPFEWTAACQQAFDVLKQKLTTAPLLVGPNPDLPYQVRSDASQGAIGAVLMQDHGKGPQPVEYMSRSMTSAERNYPVHEQELLGLVVACHKWEHLLKGAQFSVASSAKDGQGNESITLMTDHRPLVHVLEQTRMSKRMAGWMEFLGGFGPFSVRYIPGTQNVVPDALSRRRDLMGSFHEDLDICAALISVVECGALTRAQANNQKVSQLLTPPVGNNGGPVMLLDQGSVPELTGVQEGVQSLSDSLRRSPDGVVPTPTVQPGEGDPARRSRGRPRKWVMDPALVSRSKVLASQVMARPKGAIATTVSSKQLVASPGQEEEMQMQPLGPDKDLVLPNPLNISLLDVIKAFTKTEDMATAAIQRGPTLAIDL